MPFTTDEVEAVPVLTEENNGFEVFFPAAKGAPKPRFVPELESLFFPSVEILSGVDTASFDPALSSAVVPKDVAGLEAAYAFPNEKAVLLIWFFTSPVFVPDTKAGLESSFFAVAEPKENGLLSVLEETDGVPKDRGLDSERVDALPNKDGFPSFF